MNSLTGFHGDGFTGREILGTKSSLGFLHVRRFIRLFTFEYLEVDFVEYPLVGFRNFSGAVGMLVLIRPRGH